MSAILCGKRSFIEEIDPATLSPAYVSPPALKRFRRASSTSPVRFTYSPPAQSSPIDQLKALFPDMDIQLLAKALEDAGHDLDLAVQSIRKLNIGYSDGHTGSTEGNITGEQGAVPPSGNVVPLQEPQGQNKLPEDGMEWVNLFVTEMASATSIDDARCRAAQLLESLEKTISSHASAEAVQNIQKENVMLKEQIEAFLRENSILKRAVAIQHERQKEYDEKINEVPQLKQLLAQYQEQLRTLELNNYALTQNLRYAQQGNLINGRFNPDVF